MKKAKIGLLGLYLELYDHSLPEMRPGVEKFYQTIVDEMEKRGIEVIPAAICRLKSEFASAVKSFEDAQVDAIVTLHLAYSPSLESLDILTETSLPILVLDTTPTYKFGPDQDPDEILYNHGIHGVQDMCNLLIRNEKLFKLEAGHWEQSDVLDRVASRAHSAQLAANMRSARVGRIGGPFKGMGDFVVPADILKQTIGVETIPCDPGVIRSLLPAADDKEVGAEMAADHKKFVTEGIDAEMHRLTTRVGLAVRRWIEKENLSAFTVNFLAIDPHSGLPTVPFLEASKTMARGLGYAGEGDVLTAALVGALSSVYPETTFTEMFCPDWENNRIFLSHMGEMNINLTDDTPRLIEKPFPYTDAENPVAAVGRFRGGRAALVNLAPGPNRSYTLIVAPVTMTQVKGSDRMADSIRGWFKPEMEVADFLTEYSRAGGTHHSALVYGIAAREIAGFAEMMGWKAVLLQ